MIDYGNNARTREPGYFHENPTLGQYCPAPALSNGFVAELTRIGGIAEDGSGMPQLRVAWGPDQWFVRYERRVPRYPQRPLIHRRFDEQPNGQVLIHDEEIRFGWPRWFLEEWKSFAELRPGGQDEHDHVRYEWAVELVRDDSGKLVPTVVYTDVLGPLAGGEYRMLCPIQFPNGDFMPADFRILPFIEEAYYIRRNRDRRAIDVDRDYEECKARLQARDEAKIAASADRMADNLRPHMYRLVEGKIKANKGGSGPRVFLDGSKRDGRTESTGAVLTECC